MGGVTEQNVRQYLNHLEHLPHNPSECLWSWVCNGTNSAAADFSKQLYTYILIFGGKLLVKLAQIIQTDISAQLIHMIITVKQE